MLLVHTFGAISCISRKSQVFGNFGPIGTNRSVVVSV
jgi:hypothetical protein